MSNRLMNVIRLIRAEKQLQYLLIAVALLYAATWFRLFNLDMPFMPMWPERVLTALLLAGFVLLASAMLGVVIAGFAAWASELPPGWRLFVFTLPGLVYIFWLIEHGAG